MNEEMIKTGVEEDMPQKFKIERIKKSAPTAERGKVPDPHMHPFHEIFYLESGTCSSLIGHTLYTFEKGDIVIVPAHEIHRTVYTGSGQHERIVLSFRTEVVSWIDEFLDSSIVEDNVKPIVIHIPEKRRSYVEALFNKMLFESGNVDELSEGFIRIALAELLLFLVRCRKYEENVIKELDVSNALMQEIATYIYDYYDRKITLDTITAKFGISRSYLSKKFKSATGFGFKEYLLNVRMKNACAMLLNTNKSITEIAFACGFNDSNYFGDAFRHMKGVSPNQYRKNSENV